MLVESLNGQWEFRQKGQGSWSTAVVPGGVHTDLIRLGQIPDPFIGMHERDVQWVAERDWEYRKIFTVLPGLMQEQRVELVCEGLDTLAEVFLNGEQVGRGENQFRCYRWDLKELLRPDGNELIVHFLSPLRYIKDHMGTRSLPGIVNGIRGGQYLRKSPFHFGWDWGPRLPVIGIWKDIYIEGFSHSRLEDVHLRQVHHAGGTVTVRAEAVINVHSGDRLLLELEIITPQSHLLKATAEFVDLHAGAEITIDQPSLWWPNGLGQQPLYTVEVKLVSGETVLDRYQRSIGLRKVELRREPDEWGQSFTFAINGIPLFCKGANWIPADSFHTRIVRERLENLISSAAAANQNMLRVWGGGIYESDDFYDLCDRYGILVWQDFIFSCNVYPLQQASFVENVHVEVMQNVRRIRDHACLVLWCGNNEMELGWWQWAWSLPWTQDLKQANTRFFFETLPGWLKSLDPDTPYWPSSPSSGDSRKAPNGEWEGDAHYWDVWHMLAPITAYRSKQPRFASEFGMQAIPSPLTIAEFAPREHWRLDSEIMLHHQRAPMGTRRLKRYARQNYRPAKSFENFIYVTQVLQAEALRTGVEHWRRLWPRTAGALYWQLNDVWPVLSWSTIDYFGRWKAAQYAARRFFAPVLLSVESRGRTLTLWLTGDLRETSQWTVKWSLERLDGQVIDAGEKAVDLQPGASMPVQILDFSRKLKRRDIPHTILVTELWQEDQLISRQVEPFVGARSLRLTDPEFDVDVSIEEGQLQFELTARRLARFIEVSFEGIYAQLSDNFFDLPAGRTVLVTCRLPEGWTLEQARDALRIRSLFHSFI